MEFDLKLLINLTILAMVFIVACRVWSRHD